MQDSSDQQPLFPPTLRRFQAAEDRYSMQLKQHATDVHSEVQGPMTPGKTSRIRSSQNTWPVDRTPKSTVHGVVHQFGMLHYQRSTVDRVWTSIGNIFRRICKMEERTLRLLEDNHIDDVDIITNDAPEFSQNSVPQVASGDNIVNEVKSRNEDYPVLRMPNFKETSPNLQNIPCVRCSYRHTDKSIHNSASDKNLYISWDNDSSDIRLVKRTDELHQRSNVTNDCNRTPPMYSTPKQHRHTACRKCNLSKIFQTVRSSQSSDGVIHRNCSQSHMMPLSAEDDAALEDFEAKRDHSSKSSTDVEADATTVESIHLSFPRRISPNNLLASVHSGMNYSNSHNDLVFRKWRKCDDHNSICNNKAYKPATSKSDTTITRCGHFTTFSANSNLLTCGHLTVSIDDLATNLESSFGSNYALVNSGFKSDNLIEENT